MTKRILTGNEAVGLGALRAGVKVVTGYPGTPSTGVVASLLTMDLPGRHVEWSTNEKVAFEIAAGAAWAGRRAMVTMKMSGVNVAYDALISIAYSGTNGGLVIYVADDPGVSAGMPEQDSRGFALLADLPMLEPASAAEAYDLVGAAFELSERAGTPVFLRLTTAVALTHATVDIAPGEAPSGRAEVDKSGGLKLRGDFAAGEALGARTGPGESGGLILERDIARYTKAGSKICLDQHRALIERMAKAEEIVRAMGLNRVTIDGPSGGVGVVAVGPVFAYLGEALAAAGLGGADVSTLRAVTTFPFPTQEIEALLRHCGTVLVLEELEPHFERQLVVTARRAGFAGRIVGKLDGTLSRLGEYGVKDVLKGLVACGLPSTGEALVARGPWRAGEKHVACSPWHVETAWSPQTTSPVVDAGASPVPQATSYTPQAGVPPSPQVPGDEPQAASPAPRPITVCAGCPHRGTYLAIAAAIQKAGFKKDDVMVTGDIGCTILGMNPPFELLWNEVSMGSSISLAQGYVHAGIETPVIATIGDSTFFHGGIPGLLNAVQHRTPLTLVVMDNGWTAMTGMQVNPGTDEAFQTGGRRIDLARILPALGVDRFEIVDPYDLVGMTGVLAECLGESGVKVVLARRECAIQAKRRGVEAGRIAFDAEKCVLCKRCIRRTGCPALSLTDGRIAVDENLCNGCGLCAAVCPTQALGRSPNGGRERLGENPPSGGFSKDPRGAS